MVEIGRGVLHVSVSVALAHYEVICLDALFNCDDY